MLNIITDVTSTLNLDVKITGGTGPQGPSGDTNKIITIQNTTPYNITSLYNTIICDRATGMTINLLSATGSGFYIIIKNINSGIVTIDRKGTDIIDGDISKTLSQWNSISLVDYISGKWVVV